jgi:2,3-dihydroxybiphenyl 1,2-dioxygenase
MKLQTLGYVGLRTSKLDDWEQYGTRLLGMQLVDRTRNSLALRMDDHKQRLIVNEDGGDGAGFFGFEVEGASALEALGAHLERHGVKVARGARALADERCVKDLIVFSDPAGNRLEVFHGPHKATDPFKPGRALSGFRTGPLGMGHVVLMVERVDDMIPFYQDILGFHLSDYFTRPFKVYFFHLNPRHHSLGMLESGKRGVHHMMVEACFMDDVGQGWDLAQMKPESIASTLGRHVNDHVTSFYTYNPSNFMTEFGWGGRSIEVDNWTPREVTEGPSLWGHDRSWLSPEALAESKRIRMQASAEGLRIPLDVMEGNHKVAPGTCLLWDAVSEARKRGYA